jgi:Transglycosylase SLT domain
MKGCVLAALTVLSLISAVMCARAEEPFQPPDASGTMGRAKARAAEATARARPNIPTPLDRVARAVDGAESSHGEDPGMWRPDPAGPQGPMQVSGAAATDVGGGDRFDMVQNRAMGRAYLAQLYWRYKNWPDAIAAYNWGSGNLEAWVKAGRPADKFLTAVAVYLRRVLHDSGLCDNPPAALVRWASQNKPLTSPQQQQADAGAEAAQAETFEHAVCGDLANWAGTPDGLDRHVFGRVPNRFYSRLEKAMGVALAHLEGSNPVLRGRGNEGSGAWALAMGRP